MGHLCMMTAAAVVLTNYVGLTQNTNQMQKIEINLIGPLALC